MKQKIQKVLIALQRPKGIALALTYVLTVIAITASMLMLFVEYEGSWIEILAYTSFAFAAIGLGYSIYTIVIYAKGAKERVTLLVRSIPITNRLLSNWGYRTLITTVFTFAITLVNSLFNAYLGISEKSIWFGALAAYYIILSLCRGGLLLHHTKKRDTDKSAILKARNYKRCGILLLLLNATLSSAIAQMIFDDRGFEYKDWFIYAFAAYAFYKIFMSVRNVARARKQDDLTLQAIRNINLIDAAVSILALQTALLHTFSDGTADISLFNTLTGSAVSLGAITLSIFMIIKGAKTEKKLKSETK